MNVVCVLSILHATSKCVRFADGQPRYDFQCLSVGVYHHQMSFDCYVCVPCIVILENTRIVFVPIILFAWGWSIINLLEHCLEQPVHSLVDASLFLLSRYIQGLLCWLLRRGLAIRPWSCLPRHECCFVLLSQGWDRLETRPPVALGSSPVMFVCLFVL